MQAGADAREGTDLARRGFGRRVSYALRAAWLVAILVAALTGIAAGAQDAGSTVVAGTVRDAGGAALSGAAVRLKSENRAVAETRSHADGTFLFAAIAPGEYTVNAEKAGVGSGSAGVKVDGSRKVTIDVTIRPERAGRTSGAAGGMEFADEPNFTIAGVTDWTAAGGHGSDTVLRASEALNREAIRLGPEENAKAPTPETAAWKERESALRAAVAKEPADFAANRALGVFYLEAQRDEEAVAPLRAASQARPKDAANELDLARALRGAGKFAEAREAVRRVLVREESGDAERLAGELDEKLGDPLTAVHEFERAAQADPSEQNYFEWGSELLLHRAVWQAEGGVCGRGEGVSGFRADDDGFGCGAFCGGAVRSGGAAVVRGVGFGSAGSGALSVHGKDCHGSLRSAALRDAAAGAIPGDAATECAGELLLCNGAVEAGWAAGGRAGAAPVEALLTRR